LRQKSARKYEWCLFGIEIDSGLALFVGMWQGARCMAAHNLTGVPIREQNRIAEHARCSLATIRKAYRGKPTQRSSWERVTEAAFFLELAPPGPWVSPDSGGRK
jgi:hypothetical protein